MRNSNGGYTGSGGSREVKKKQQASVASYARKKIIHKVIITGGRWSKESRTKCGTRNSGCQPARCIIKCWLSRVRRGVEIARTGLRVRARDPDNTHRGGGESRGGKAKKKRRKKVEKESCCTNSRVAHSQRLA